MDAVIGIIGPVISPSREPGDFFLRLLQTGVGVILAYPGIGQTNSSGPGVMVVEECNNPRSILSLPPDRGSLVQSLPQQGPAGLVDPMLRYFTPLFRNTVGTDQIWEGASVNVALRNVEPNSLESCLEK